MEELIMVVNVPNPAISGSNAIPAILSAVLPNGQMHTSAIAHGTQGQTSDDSCKSGMMGATSCWKPISDSIDADRYAEFVGYKSIVEKFYGSDMGSNFKPIKYKVQVVAGIIYTIQYQVKVADGKLGTVQATIYVPLVSEKNKAGVVSQVSKPAEVTQFVDTNGVTTGAFKLGTSIVMMASLIASVMLA